MTVMNDFNNSKLENESLRVIEYSEVDSSHTYIYMKSKICFLELKKMNLKELDNLSYQSYFYSFNM